MDLFVKSEKIDQASQTIPSWATCSTGHFGDAYTSKEVMTCFLPEDREAIEFLRQKDISFNLVDLSNCSFISRLQAKINGINKTPTLILDNGTKLRGVEVIKKRF